MIVTETAIVWLENVFVTRGILEARAIPNVMLEIPVALKMVKHKRTLFRVLEWGTLLLQHLAKAIQMLYIEHIHGLLVSQLLQLPKNYYLPKVT